MLLKRRPTIRQVFALSLLGLLLGLTLLFYLVLDGSLRAILQSSERYRNLASREVAQRVITYLNEAPMAVDHFEQQIKYGLLDPQKKESAEQGLLSLLLANENISEATLTYGDNQAAASEAGTQADTELAQITVLRTAAPNRYLRKLTWSKGRKFFSISETLSPGSVAPSVSAPAPIAAVDPREHLTYQTAVSQRYYGVLIPSDLHWSQIDEGLPESRRRVEVSVQKTIEDVRGHFIGVLRIGLMKSQIDGAVQQHITGAREPDPHLIFLCDDEGRLITGFGHRDQVMVSGDDLRIAPGDTPPVVTRALKTPVLADFPTDRDAEVATSFRFEGKIYLCTFRSVPGTQDWIVGIVVPQDFYLGKLAEIRRHVLWTSLALMAAIVVIGVLIIRSIVRAQSLILRETSRMNAFEFAPARNPSYLRDVDEVLLSLEKAKTAMRSMGKYVPVDLVRRLYHEGQEPVLGGESAELSVLFTDIKNFTTFAETSGPDELARLLGLYLHVMATVIQTEKGTVDKYIGDAVMAFWNAPERLAHHEIFACRAALGCQDALRVLYDSPPWGGAPHFETSFGLHRCTASVGHFGAPDRFNYTAIGDGINLASRLEGLNKNYGTTIIVSESVQVLVDDIFVMRLLDRVAVKGKTEALTIYELIGEKARGASRSDSIALYEEAFTLYQQGKFDAALNLFAQQERDAPSQVLASRCRHFIANPPAHWDGMHTFDAK